MTCVCVGGVGGGGCCCQSWNSEHAQIKSIWGKDRQVFSMDDAFLTRLAFQGALARMTTVHNRSLAICNLPSVRSCARAPRLPTGLKSGQLGVKQPTTKLHVDFRWKQQHFCLVGRHLQYRDHIKVRTVRGYPFLPAHAGVPQDLQDEPSATLELSNAAIETHPASVDEDGRPRGICRPSVRRTWGRSSFVGFVQTSAS